jgi:hypothetical protein
VRQQDATGLEAALLPAHADHFVGSLMAANDIETGLFPQKLELPPRFSRNGRGRRSFREPPPEFRND